MEAILLALYNKALSISNPITRAAIRQNNNNDVLNPKIIITIILIIIIIITI